MKSVDAKGEVFDTLFHIESFAPKTDQSLHRTRND